MSDESKAKLVEAYSKMSGMLIVAALLGLVLWSNDVRMNSAEQRMNDHYGTIEAEFEKQTLIMEEVRDEFRRIGNGLERLASEVRRE